MKVALEGKRAIVTGSAQGIGKAIADKLAANGARMVYADINYEQAKISAAATPGAIALPCDITKKAQVESMVAEVVKQFGGIDILVNNAGVNTAKHRVNIDEFPEEEWNRLVNIDLTGTYLMTQTVAKVMIQQKSGRIVNISSTMGVVPARRQCAFIAAKAGVNQLTRGVALELAPFGISVNCVAPGSTLTEGTKGLFYSQSASEADFAKRMLSHVPMARPGTTDEIGTAVLFFCDPDNSYTTGQVLACDGGWTAGGFYRDF